MNGIVLVYPGLVTGPILWSLGWTSNGPRAGRYPLAPSCAQSQVACSELITSTASAAAALMSRLGPVPSRGVFAYLQSSQMGGFGAPLVQGATRAGSLGLGAVELLISSWHGSTSEKVNDDHAGVAKSQEAELKAEEPVKVQAEL